MRKALSPTFTSGKLKGMTYYMDKTVDKMIHFLDSKGSGSVVDIKELFRCLSLDIIANCAFGIDTDSFNNPSNDLLQKCLQVFTDFSISNMTENIVFQILRIFPGLVSVLDVYGKENYEHLKNITKSIVNSRIDPRGDFIDILKELKDRLSEDETNAQGMFSESTVKPSNNKLFRKYKKFTIFRLLTIYNVICIQNESLGNKNIYKCQILYSCHKKKPLSICGYS